MLGRPVRTDFQVFVQSGRVPVFSSSEDGFYEELRVIMYYVVIFHNYIPFFIVIPVFFVTLSLYCDLGKGDERFRKEGVISSNSMLWMED